LASVKLPSSRAASSAWKSFPRRIAAETDRVVSPATALEALSLLVAVGVWWLGIRKVELTSAAKSILSTLEIGLLVATVVTLR